MAQLRPYVNGIGVKAPEELRIGDPLVAERHLERVPEVGSEVSSWDLDLPITSGISGITGPAAPNQAD
jgi:hypothetical protein